MKVTVITGLLAKGYVYINTSHKDIKIRGARYKVSSIINYLLIPKTKVNMHIGLRNSDRYKSSLLSNIQPILFSFCLTKEPHPV